MTEDEVILLVKKVIRDSLTLDIDTEQGRYGMNTIHTISLKLDGELLHEVDVEMDDGDKEYM